MIDSQFNFDPEKHEFSDAKGIIPSVTQILHKVGLCDYSFIEEEKRQASMKRGTSVHWMTRLEDEGGLNYRRLSKPMRGYRRAWKAWKANSGFTPTSIEVQIFDPQLRYAGIIDRFGRFRDDSYAVIDLKTGVVQNAVKYQLVGYCALASFTLTAASARVIRRIAVRLMDDGRYFAKEFPQSSWRVDWATFVEALRRISQ